MNELVTGVYVGGGERLTETQKERQRENGIKAKAK